MRNSKNKNLQKTKNSNFDFDSSNKIPVSKKIKKPNSSRFIKNNEKLK